LNCCTDHLCDRSGVAGSAFVDDCYLHVTLSIVQCRL